MTDAETFAIRSTGKQLSADVREATMPEVKTLPEIVCKCVPPPNIRIRKTSPNAYGKKYTATERGTGLYATGDTRTEALERLLQWKAKLKTEVKQCQK